MKSTSLGAWLMSVAVLLGGLATPSVEAQLAVPPPMPAYQTFSDQQLDQLLAPIALYPDPLLAVMLPAATLPTQIVMADRYVANGGNPDQADQQPWDPSVQALTHYASVLQYMDDNLAWTTELGQAFLNQGQAVMDSIQRLRQSAQNLGNLVSTPQEQVVDDNGEIEILPVDPNVMYVPQYQPDYVYLQGGYGCGFGGGFALGAWLVGDFNWRDHHLFFWDHRHPRPANWWHEQPGQRTAWLGRQGTVWRPENHGNPGAGRSGDRGWGQAAPAAYDRRNIIVAGAPPHALPHPATNPRLITEQPRPAEPRPTEPRQSEAVRTPPPAPVQRATPSEAFGGGESSREVRNFSERGGQSMQSTRSEPAHSAPPAAAPSHSGGGNSGGGGGGGSSHGGGKH